MSTMAGIDNCTISSNIYILNIDGYDGRTTSGSYDDIFAGNLSR